MSALDSNSIIARRTVEEYGDFSIITLPGWSTYSESEQKDLCAKIQEYQETYTLDAQTLHSALRDLSEDTLTSTPPPNLPSSIEEARRHEERARQALLEDGGQPCYPPSLAFPLQEVPQQYQEIITYWKSKPGIGHMILSAQESDWKAFRTFQGHNRRYYSSRQDLLPGLQAKIVDRRQRYNLQVANVPSCITKERAKLDDWVDFQDYHLTLHDQLESELHKECEIHKQERLREQLAQHKVLMSWIEQQRIAVDNENSLYARETRDHTVRGVGSTAGRRSPPLRRSKRLEKAVTSPVRSGIAKRPSEPTLRPRKRNDPRHIGLVSSGSPPCGVSQVHHRSVQYICEATTTAARDMTLGPSGQRVESGQSNTIRQVRRKSKQQATPTFTKTRSGRVSKRPAR